MGITVSQQMSDEERRDRLIHGLKATGDDEVTVNFSHLAQAVGMDMAEKLVINLVETEELVASRTSKTPRMMKSGMCSIDRAAALKACEDCKAEAEMKKVESKVNVPSPQKKAIQDALKAN